MTAKLQHFLLWPPQLSGIGYRNLQFFLPRRLLLAIRVDHLSTASRLIRALNHKTPQKSIYFRVRTDLARWGGDASVGVCCGR